MLLLVDAVQTVQSWVLVLLILPPCIWAAWYITGLVVK